MNDYDKEILNRALGMRTKLIQAYNSQHEYGNHRPRVLLNLSAEEVLEVIRGLWLLEGLANV